MKKKALFKDFLMELKHTKSRFLSILFIVALGVSFFTGIRSTRPDMKLSADLFYDENHLMDITVISTLGLTDDDVTAIKHVDGIEKVEGGYSADMLAVVNENQFEVKLLSYSDTINQPSIKEGDYPKNSNECLVDTEFLTSTGYRIGDKLSLKSGTQDDIFQTLKYDEYLIVGSCTSPLYLTSDKGTTSIGDGDVNSFIMLADEAFTLESYTDLYATVSGSNKLNTYSKQYEKLIDHIKDSIEDEVKEERINSRYSEIEKKAKQELRTAKTNLENAEKKLSLAKLAKEHGQNVSAESIEIAESKIADGKQMITEAEADLLNLEKPEWYLLDRNSIPSYVSYFEDANRIGAIGKVFPIIFFLVAALVSLTTMTRMVEEERTQIGTLKALGYSKLSIASKYIMYALFATIAGSILGGLIGSKLFPYIIITAYQIMYVNLEVVAIPMIGSSFLLAMFIAVFCVVTATILSCYKELATTPAQLMRPASPKVGKRVFLERIPFLWKRLNFTWKSTIRNLIRYKKRFFMTIFGIAGCMALILVAFGLNDSIFTIVDIQYDNISLYDGVITLDTDAKKEDIDKTLNFIHTQNHIKDSTLLHEKLVNVHYKDEKNDVYLLVTKDPNDISDYYTLRDRISKEPYFLSDDNVIITEKLSKLLGVKVGDTIYIDQGNLNKVEVTIGAITENYILHNIYMTPTLYHKLYHSEPDYNKILYLNSNITQDIKEKFTKEVLYLDGVTSNVFTSTIRNDFEESMNSLNIVIYIIILAAAGLAFVVLYNLNNINISERRRELATLKVLGFYDTEVSAYVFRENILLTIIGILFGIVFGAILHQFVIVTVETDMLMFGRSLNAFSYIKSIVLTFLFSLLINFTMYFKLKKVDMTTSLKSVE